MTASSGVVVNPDEIHRLLQDYPLSLTFDYYSKCCCGGGDTPKGFRTTNDNIEHLSGVAVRVGLILAIKSLQSGMSMGVMITAAELDDSFHGLRVVDFSDNHSSLRTTKEKPSFFDEIAPLLFDNQSNDTSSCLQEWVYEIAQKQSFTSYTPVVHIGRDTREHSESFANLVASAAQAAGARVVDHGEITTPCLQYCVAHDNALVSPFIISRPLCHHQEDGYYEFLATSYATLVQGTHLPEISLLVDCAGGIGHVAVRQFIRSLQEQKCMRRMVPSNRPFSGSPLNGQCGSDFVRSKKQPPCWYNTPPISKVFCASLNGDATDVVLFSETDGAFYLVDDDKVPCLICSFLVTCLDTLIQQGVLSPIRVVAVPASTNTQPSTVSYLQSILGNDGVLTMETDVEKVKCDVCVQLADPSNNSIGCIQFRDTFYSILQDAEKNVQGISENTEFNQLKTLSSLFYCSVVPDGLTTLLVVDAILRLQNKTIHDLHALY